MRTDDIVRQRFAKVFRGYDVQEVDLFLDDVIREMDRLEQERNSLLVRLEALLQELDRCDRALREYQLKANKEAAPLAAKTTVAREEPIAPDALPKDTQTEPKHEEPAQEPPKSGAEPEKWINTVSLEQPASPPAYGEEGSAQDKT